MIYYSKTGKTEKMALQIAKGVETAGVNVISKKVED
jgi:flavodoxin